MKTNLIKIKTKMFNVFEAPLFTKVLFHHYKMCF